MGGDGPLGVVGRPYDFDNAGSPESYITCGMLTGPSESICEVFFWRPGGAKSPLAAERSEEYEHG